MTTIYLSPVVSSGTTVPSPWLSAASGEDFDTLAETIEILGDPEAMAQIQAAEEADAHGDVIQGRDAVQALRPRR
jgi:hypothetical protein